MGVQRVRAVARHARRHSCFNSRANLRTSGVARSRSTVAQSRSQNHPFPYSQVEEELFGVLAVMFYIQNNTHMDVLVYSGSTGPDLRRNIWRKGRFLLS